MQSDINLETHGDYKHSPYCFDEAKKKYNFSITGFLRKYSVYLSELNGDINRMEFILWEKMWALPAKAVLIFDLPAQI